MGSGTGWAWMWQWLLSWHGESRELTCQPTPEQFTHLLTVLVTSPALCCLSWVDDGEREILLWVWGLFNGLAEIGLVSEGYVIKLQVYVIKYAVIPQWI